MELSQFLLKLKECKKSQIMTGSSDRIGELRVTVNLDRTIFHIEKKQEKKICSKCGCDLTKSENNSITIIFNKPQMNLTIFQTYMLYMIFRLKLIPYDYASYHKCIAGQRFIENIGSVTQ